MATLKTQILEYLIRTGGEEDDDRLAELFGVRRQATNQACRQLEADGLSPDGWLPPERP